MPRIAAFIVVAALSACGTNQPQQPSAFYRSGNGLVEAVRAVAVPSPEPVQSVQAGGSRSDPLSTYSQPAFSSRAFQAESASTGPSGVSSQFIVRMDDGSRQSVVAPTKDYAVGDRVHITPEGRVARQ